MEYVDYSNVSSVCMCVYVCMFECVCVQRKDPDGHLLTFLVNRTIHPAHIRSRKSRMSCIVCYGVAFLCQLVSSTTFNYERATRVHSYAVGTYAVIFFVYDSSIQNTEVLTI